MIEISFGKLVLLALIVLIVLGPEKLPKVARTAGTIMRRVRQNWDSIRNEVERELALEDIRRSTRDAARQVEAVEKGIKSELNQWCEPLDDTITAVKSVQLANVQEKQQPSPPIDPAGSVAGPRHPASAPVGTKSLAAHTSETADGQD